MPEKQPDLKDNNVRRCQMLVSTFKDCQAFLSFRGGKGGGTWDLKLKITDIWEGNILDLLGRTALQDKQHLGCLVS